MTMFRFLTHSGVTLIRGSRTLNCPANLIGRGQPVGWRLNSGLQSSGALKYLSYNRHIVTNCNYDRDKNIVGTTNLNHHPQSICRNSSTLASSHGVIFRVRSTTATDEHDLPSPAIILRHRRAGIHTTAVRWDIKDSSKVETTVKALKKGQQQDDQMSEAVGAQDTPATPSEATSTPPTTTTTATSQKKVVQKRSIGKRVWDEIVHYYHGFRLLFIDIRIASKLLLRVVRGDELSRREHRQLVRTSADVFRLVPFSVFVIVPFMEFLLPVFLKFFPGMLPSTFESSTDKDAKIKTQLKLKLEVAKFLQNTLDDMALTSKGDQHSHNAKEFAQFFDKIRSTGQQATNAQILKFSSLFEDEMTLDALSRPQLVGLCRLLELKPIGTNMFLTFQLRMKLRSLKADDVMIHKEGVDSLTVPELQSACRARGMRAIGVSEDRLRSQLDQWLELSLNEQIPPSLLLLSRALYLPETVTQADSLKATIESLPDEVKTEARYKIGETEGKVDNKTKIEIIRKEQEAIERERKEREAEKLAEEQTEILNQRADILIDKAKEIGEQDLTARLQEPGWTREDLESIENALENVAAEKSRLLVEKEEFEELKEEMREYKEDIEEFKELATAGGTGSAKLSESKAAARLRKRVDKMITKMDTIFGGLESQKANLQEKIETLAKDGQEVEHEKGDVITINELLLAIKRLQKVPDDTKLQRTMEVLDMMDVDHDGKIEIEHVVRVLDLLGRENVKVDSEQMKEIIELLIREEKIEDEEKKRKSEENGNNNNGTTTTVPMDGNRIKNGDK